VLERRVQDRPLPSVTVVDMREAIRGLQAGRGVEPTLADAIGTVVARASRRSSC
jgi:hypothetical protein